MMKKQSLPPLKEILDEVTTQPDKDQARHQAEKIEKTLADFELAVQVHDIHYSPRLNQFSLELDSDVKVSQVKRLEQDLAVALAGDLVRLEEPTANYPYIRLIAENHQTPNLKLRQILLSDEFKKADGALKIGLGLDIFGQPVIIDLAAMPHLLIGGTTGSGKSVCINAIVTSLLSTYRPAEVQLLLIDPLQIELRKYTGIPHLFKPVVSHSSQVLEILTDLIREIDDRYWHMAQAQVRDITAYNQKVDRTKQKKLPYLVIIIDNLLDLMMKAPKEVEQSLTRIAQKARGAGIHMILATLRARSDTVTGSIKANFPGRIAFKVTDRAESRLILDVIGAEMLLGEGDMLYKAPNTNELQRLQGVRVSERELDRLVTFWRKQKKS